MSYLILLLRVLVLKFIFLCLQLAYPVPQLLCFFPVAHEQVSERVLSRAHDEFMSVGRLILSWIGHRKYREWPEGAGNVFAIVCFLFYLSESSLMWSTFSSLRRSLRIFFFFSRSVCLLGPVCVCTSERRHVCWRPLNSMSCISLWHFIKNREEIFTLYPVKLKLDRINFFLASSSAFFFASSSSFLAFSSWLKKKMMMSWKNCLQHLSLVTTLSHWQLLSELCLLSLSMIGRWNWPEDGRLTRWPVSKNVPGATDSWTVLRLVCLKDIISTCVVVKKKKKKKKSTRKSYLKAKTLS